VFLRVPKKATLGIWILTIARNIAIDHIRSAQSRFQTTLRSIEQTYQLSFSYKPMDPVSVLDSAKAVREGNPIWLPNINRTGAYS
jgi:DNA-directed RNA polymerase specialized sigma24 family protein